MATCAGGLGVPGLEIAVWLTREHADELDPEVARLEALGARRERFLKRWWIVQVPTGHRFCIVRQQPVKPALRMNA